MAELTAPTYGFTSTGKMVVESKADMKKRGLRSPDFGHALLTFAGAERRKERYRKPEPRGHSAWAVWSRVTRAQIYLGGAYYVLTWLCIREVTRRTHWKFGFRTPDDPSEGRGPCLSMGRWGALVCRRSKSTASDSQLCDRKTSSCVRSLAPIIHRRTGGKHDQAEKQTQRVFGFPHRRRALSEA